MQYSSMYSITLTHLSTRLSLNSKEKLWWWQVVTTKKISTVQTDNFKVPQGKWVASQVLSSGEWKFRVKPEFFINKHKVEKSNKSKHSIPQHENTLGLSSTKSEEQRKWLTSVDVTNLNSQSDPTVVAIWFQAKQGKHALN